MTDDPAPALEGIWAAWRVGNKAATLAWLADDAMYAQHIPADVVPSGGMAIGKRAVSDRLQTLLDLFETIDYDGTVTGVDGPTARGQVAFRFRHRVTGHEIEATMRMIIKVRNGLIVTLDEFHDVERIRAFMALIAYDAAPEQ